MAKKTYQYILLDWDGNIARTLDLWLDVIHTTLRARGMSLSDDEVIASFQSFERHAREVWHVEDPARLFREANALAQERLARVELYPDALLVIEEMKSRGKRLALVTASRHANIQGTLERYNMQELFDAVIAADDVKQHKPHPEPLLAALAKLGGNTDNAVMIGDSGSDIGAANNAGCDSILFYPPEHAKFYDFDMLKAHEPTHVVTDFRDILDIRPLSKLLSPQLIVVDSRN